MSIFHAVSAFNNAGFDLFGDYQSLTAYSGDLLMNLVTAALIIIAGLGYLAMFDILSFKKPSQYSLQTKMALCATAVLLIAGMLLLRLTDGYTWLQCFFQSVTARTAGFNTVDLAAMSPAGKLVMVLLMTVGASPGSTGGGTKTTTWFVLLTAAYSAASGRHVQAFHRRIPQDVVQRAFLVVLLSFITLCTATFLICLFQPELGFMAVLFEVASAVNTVGVTTGITGSMSTASRAVLMAAMYIGRLGPLTAVTMWHSGSPAPFGYSEESVTVG